VNETLEAGKYQFEWDGKTNAGKDCPAGIYNVILKTDKGIRASRKLIKS